MNLNRPCPKGPHRIRLAAALGALAGALAAPAAGWDQAPPAVERAIEISDAFKAVAQRARPSVARIAGFTAGGAKVGGSAFLIDSEGHLLTNNHVVEPAVSLLAEFSDGRILPAMLVGADPLTDLAVVRIDGSGHPALEFTNAEHVEVGEWVVAVGFPLGLEQTVTVGVISATNRRLNIVGSSIGRRGYEDFIQTDAAINRGNSGGPLLNLRGEVVGVNAAIVTQTGGSDGLGFAIPTSLARNVADELIRKGRVVRAWLGVGLQDITPALAVSYGLAREQSGVLLTSIQPDEPAGLAGLLPEDIITTIDGRSVLSVEDLRTQVARMQPGKRIMVEVHRRGRLRTVEVILGEMPGTQVAARPRFDPARGGRLGLMLEDLTETDLRNLRETTAVRVAQLIPGRPAQLSGIEEGDLIVAVDGQPLRAVRIGVSGRSSARWLIEMLESASPGTVLRFTLRRRVVNAAGRIAGYEPVYSFVAVEMH